MRAASGGASGSARACPARFVIVLALGLATPVHGCIESPSPPPKSGTEGAAPRNARRVATAPSNGFNDDIAWHGLDEGLAQAKQTGRPLMLLVHASWCNRCKELVPVFHDERIEALSERFVMVNVDQDREPRVEAYAPDGTYIPRVLFFDPDTGRPDTSLLNPRRSRTRYYYSPVDDLAGVMTKALARYGET